MADKRQPGMVLSCRGLSKSFGGIAAAQGVDLDVAANEIHAVIGPNGAGKTTLVAQLSGELRPDAGTVVYRGRDVTALRAHARARLGIARSFQITSVFLDMPAIANVALAVQARQGHSFRFWKKAADDPALGGPALAALGAVGLEARAGAPASALSHGERRQLEIAMALATGAGLLLLDEPMAGMGREETAAMVAILSALKAERAMLLVEHDMDAVFALADRITVLVDGRVMASGAPDAIRGDDVVRRAYLGEEG